MHKVYGVLGKENFLLSVRSGDLDIWSLALCDSYEGAEALKGEIEADFERYQIDDHCHIVELTLGT